MSVLNTGTYGAKRQSFKEASPRALLLELVSKNKGASEKQLRALFRDKIRADEDYLEAIEEYWWANHYKKLVRPRPALISTMQRQKADEDAEAVVRSVVRKEAETLILDFVCPNGKRLRDNTGTYAKKLGGGIARIGTAAGPNVIGKIITDKQAQLLWTGKSP